MKLRKLLLKEEINFAVINYTKGVYYGYSNKLFRSMLTEIQKLGSNYYLIEMAMANWKGFRFNDAKKILDSFKDKKLDTVWKYHVPKGTKETKEKIQKLKQSAVKFPKKEFKL